jgi:hypothetical protein
MPRHALLDSQQLEEVDDDTVQRRALILSSCNRYAGQARRAVKAVSVVNAVDIIDRVSQSNPMERIFLQYLTSWFMHRCKSPPNSGERPTMVSQRSGAKFSGN